MNFNNVDKLNLRLIRAFIYLSQFQLNIKYRFDKKHVIFDVLSRLSFDNDQIDNRINSDDNLNFDSYHDNILNSFNEPNYYAFQNSLLIIFDDFRKQIIDDYIKKKI